MKKYPKLIALVCACLVLVLSAVPVFAASPTDEILSYEIAAYVNEDATVSFIYHVDWLVLESDGIGPVSWVDIGVPNSEIFDIYADSNNISDIYLTYSGGSMLEICFNREYYEGETISFEFGFTADYMYQINSLEDGLTTYYFTPGWFDEIAVDNLVLVWDDENVVSKTGGGACYNGYNVWQTSLGPGERFQINVSYDNSAYPFSEYNQMGYSDNYYGGSDYSDGSAAFGLIPLLLIFFGIRKIKRASAGAFSAGSGFASGKTEKKVTRTKVVYYDTCPGCGAPRPDGESVCPYCGRSLIKSEEVIEEKNVASEDKDALKYNKKGEYHYSSDPNTFVRVNVIHVPVAPSRPVSSGSSRPSGHSGSSHSSRGGGGCAHSSCACACASCACACACACAGGGRAGCTTKDFYNTNLKLKQLELKKR